jgi:hypothetical protein
MHAPVVHGHLVGQDLRDQAQQRLPLDRLDDVSVRAQFLRAAAIEFVGFRRTHDDLDRGEIRPAADFPAEFEAVHFRHDDVADDAIGPIDRDFPQRLHAGGVGLHAVPAFLEHRLHEFEDDGIVVYDQELHVFLLSFRSGRRPVCAGRFRRNSARTPHPTPGYAARVIPVARRICIDKTRQNW